MTDQQLARILSAILSECTMADIKHIHDTQAQGWHAGMQLGTSSQAIAHTAEQEAIAAAIANMTRHGRDKIARTIADQLTTQEA